MVSLFCCALFAVVASVASAQQPSEIWFASPVDHFNSQDERTFQQRCLVNDTVYKRGSGAPIFFYTGNEGPIEEFCDNTGFVFDQEIKGGTVPKV